MILHGAHVRLREIKPDDAAMTCRWRHSERAALLHLGAHTEAEQRRWIETRPSNEYNFIIELTDGTPVGMYALVNVTTSAELGRWLIAERTPGYGPARIAADAQWVLLRFAFETLRLRRLTATTDPANTGSRTWHRYFGWTVLGTDLELSATAYRMAEPKLRLVAGER